MDLNTAPSLDELLAYRHDLTDAITNDEPITSHTELVQLYRPAYRHCLDSVLQSLTGVARPAEPVTLITPQGSVFPPEHMDSGWLRPSYQLLVTCNRLLTAPVIRLECVWENFQSHVPNAPSNLKIAVDFHFNAIDENTPGISGLLFTEALVGYTRRDFKKVNELRFWACGATSQGLSKAMQYESMLGDHGQKVLRQFQSLLEPSEPSRIRLAFPRTLDPANSTFAGVLPYLTGEVILPSLQAPDWSALLPLRPTRDILDDLYAPVPYPMVPFECGDTYATVTDAVVELYESSRTAVTEQDVALREWAAVPHKGVLYNAGGMAVMAVRFEPFRLPGDKRASIPERLRATMSWKDPITGTTFVCDANRSSAPVKVPPYDALFVLLDQSPRMRNAGIKTSSQLDTKFVTHVRFTVKPSHFTKESQLNTAINLQHPDASQWHQLILNQRHDLLETRDLATKRASGIPEPSSDSAIIEEAFQKLLSFKKWNPEQLSALHSVRRALAGIVLITGPAGCGKTLLLQAICAFFRALGLHVLVLAPANTNCADFIGKIQQHFPGLDATRVFPSSTDINPTRIMKNREWEWERCPGPSADQEDFEVVQSPDQEDCNGDTTDFEFIQHPNKDHSPAQEQHQNAGDLLDFEVVRADLQSSIETSCIHEDYGLPAKVKKAAENHDFSLTHRFRGADVDAWDELRRCMQKADSKEFDWLDERAVEAYQHYYDTCKGHYMAHQKLVVTTTGNVRCRDIIDHFARDKFDIQCEGLVVILDEACKDREIDTLSALLLPDWREKITGMVMLGDEKQLAPTNVSKSEVTFNPFSDRLSISFLARLKRQGFPYTQLKEQHRMSHHISRWPAANFYPEGMRDGPGTGNLLRSKQPGLFNCLRVILDRLGSQAKSSPVEEDERVRCQYLEVRGRRDNTKRSAFVREHVKLFFEQIYWPLKSYYGEKMEDNVMIICAYKGAVNCWHEAVAHIQDKHGTPRAQMPRILTIDSSQGSEAPVTFIDCSVQDYNRKTHKNDIGFVDDDGRINVCFTRAKEVRWVIGGSCGIRKSRKGAGATRSPAYIRYREETEATIVRDLKPLDRGEEEGWLDKLKARVEVNLPIRYVDEAVREA